MLVVIVLTDQLLFRPLLAWAEKFKFEQSEAAEAPTSWLLTVIQRTRWTRSMLDQLSRLWDVSVQLFRWMPTLPRAQARTEGAGHPAEWTSHIWAIAIPVAGVMIMIGIGRFTVVQVGWQEVASVFLLGLYTALRVVILVGLATLIWVPISIRIGLKPAWASRVQPVILFLAAFPANLLFPVAVAAIVAWKLNPDVWLSPLMILGTQWYIVFNVIGGAASIPNDLKEAASNLGLTPALKWRTLLLPGTFPSYVTGGITAFGGAWNASVVAEMVSWGKTTLTAHGLGSYIAQQTAAGDIHRIVLGVAVMSLYVILFNRLLWGRLYRFAEKRLGLG
jgi:NitT/TauT family transport system permease protein